MRRLDVLNQLREDLIEVLDELTNISRGKISRRPTIGTRIAALKAEATQIRAMIRHLEREHA